MFMLVATLAGSLALTTLATYALVHYVRKEMVRARTAISRARQDFA